MAGLDSREWGNRLISNFGGGSELQVLRTAGKKNGLYQQRTEKEQHEFADLAKAGEFTALRAKYQEMPNLLNARPTKSTGGFRFGALHQAIYFIAIVSGGDFVLGAFFFML